MIKKISIIDLEWNELNGFNLEILSIETKWFYKDLFSIIIADKLYLEIFFIKFM